MNKDHVSMVLPANRYMRPIVLFAIVSLDITEYSVTKRLVGVQCDGTMLINIAIRFLLVNYFVVYIYERGCCSVNDRDILREKDLRVPPNRSRSYNLLILVLRTHFP